MEALKYVQSLPTVSKEQLEMIHLAVGDHVEHPNTTWGVAELNGVMIFIFKDGETYHYLDVNTLRRGERPGLVAYIINEKIWVYNEEALNLLSGKQVYFCEFGIDMTVPFLQQLTFTNMSKR